MSATLRIAIPQDGLTGTVPAWQPARRRLPVRLTVAEPPPEPGHGPAHSAADPAPRRNALRMPIDPEIRTDGADGLAGNPGLPDPQATAPNGDPHVRTARCGRHVAGRLAPQLASGAVRQVRVAREIARHALPGPILPPAATRPSVAGPTSPLS